MRIPWEMFMVDVSLLYIVLEDLLVYMLEVQLTCRQSKQMPIILFYMVLVIFLLYVAWSCYGADN